MYVETNQAQTITGLSSGKFKFNKTGATHRKRRKVQVLHLGPVKPPFVTVASNAFVLMNFAATLPAGTFHYEAPGGYLILDNSAIISTSLIADPSGHQYVSTTAGKTQLPNASLIQSTFHQ